MASMLNCLEYRLKQYNAALDGMHVDYISDMFYEIYSDVSEDGHSGCLVLYPVKEHDRPKDCFFVYHREGKIEMIRYRPYHKCGTEVITLTDSDFETVELIVKNLFCTEEGNGDLLDLPNTYDENKYNPTIRERNKDAIKKALESVK